MGILRKGFPYAAPENYISPEAEAMKTYLESKRADQERRKTLEDALYELEFTNWTQSLSEKEKSILMFEHTKKKEKRNHCYVIESISEYVGQVRTASCKVQN